MTELLTREWLARLTESPHILVAFSGGLDSTVLLHAVSAFPQLKSKLTAVHVHHGLSPHANAWLKHCESLSSQWQIPFVGARVQVDDSANIEERARKARYTFLQSLLQKDDCLLLGHHQDDQAETLLLNLFRGAGIDGLSAMPEIKALGVGQACRPLLAFTRKQLSLYADLHQLPYIEDESNSDSSYSRNFLRQDILPLLQERWPGLTARLARTAEHCSQARHLLDEQALQDCPQLRDPSDILSIKGLDVLSPSRMMAVLRTWLKKRGVRLPDTSTYNRLVNELVLARQDATPVVAFGGYNIRRYQDKLYLLANAEQTTPTQSWPNFPEPLMLASGAGILTAVSANNGFLPPPGVHLEIRYRHGGETLFWRGQNKSLKKLFQQWQIPVWLRANQPLLYVDDVLAAVPGYAVGDRFYHSNKVAWQLVLDNLNYKVRHPE